MESQSNKLILIAGLLLFCNLLFAQVPLKYGAQRKGKRTDSAMQLSLIHI